jgi:hypothetical protein
MVAREACGSFQLTVRQNGTPALDRDSEGKGFVTESRLILLHLLQRRKTCDQADVSPWKFLKSLSACFRNLLFGPSVNQLPAASQGADLKLPAKCADHDFLFIRLHSSGHRQYRAW